MSKLSTLRRRLGALRRRRQLIRWGNGYSVLGTAALWSLVGLFMFDWGFNLDAAQRIVIMAAAAGVILWAFRYLTVPWLGHRETDLDMALLVEQRQRIDSDLVAALQFDSPAAAMWGSAQLETAVVEYVAEFGDHVEIDEDISRGPLVRRSVLLGVTTLAILAAIVIYPAHFRAFCNRLALGTMHYPMNTSIDRLLINGREVNLGQLDERSPRSPYGRPLRFEVHWSGTVPQSGRIEMATLTDNVRTSVELQRDDARKGVFAGELPRLVDSVKFQVFLGDAWTDPRELLAIALPVVTVAFDPTPPKYALTEEELSENVAGVRQISIIEGTRVDVRVECENKALAQAMLTIGETRYPLQATDSSNRHWRLDATGTPLERIAEPLRYELQVTDEDDLQLSEPIQGFIRIKTDRPPKVTALVITQHVLPSGKPRITYGAADDYGVAELRILRQILREDGAVEEDTVEIPIGDHAEKLVQGRYPLDLSALKLVKGDQLKITLEARDFRGDLPGKTATSEPLVLHVTDERGVLAAMTESDQRSAKQMDAIIQRQLGIGE
jgi:hypothetical protein